MFSLTSPEATLPLLATTAAGLFTGSAVYISAVQHPALFETDTRFRVAYFKPMLSRAASMQKTLTLVSGAAAVSTAFLQRHDRPSTSVVWLAAGLAMVAIVPFTLATIIPVNKQLTNDAFVAKQTEEKLVGLLRRWGKLHGVRTAVSLLAFGGMAVMLPTATPSKA